MGARVQLALNVSDVDEAIAFYSRLFDSEPAKRRPGYANFAIDEPPLKLVLIEADRGGSLNHLGVEVESVDEVNDAGARIRQRGLETSDAADTTCCYAQQNKFWTQDRDGTPWEVYTVLADAPDDRSLVADTSSTEAAACACGPGRC